MSGIGKCGDTRIGTVCGNSRDGPRADAYDEPISGCTDDVEPFGQYDLATMKEATPEATHRMRWWHAPFSLIVCLLFAGMAVQEIINIRFWNDLRVLEWDAEAYYHYLPATFIQGDPLDLDYVAVLDDRLHKDHPSSYGIFHVAGTGHECMKYTCGVAFFEAPVFFVVHAYCKGPWTGYPPDGYSAPYQLGVSLSTVLFAFLGLVMLRSYMLRHVNDRSAALAIIAIALGTNLFFYCTVGSGMSHPYLFFLFAAVLERTDAWHRAPSRGKAIGLGLALGLILLTRPIDFLIVLVPLLWTHGHGWHAKWALVRKNRSHLVLAAFAVLVPLVPQMLYWKATTGHFIFYSYRGEGFNWTDPHIIDGLFSYRKGWLVWSPLVTFGFTGLILMIADRSWRSRAWPTIAFFPVALYGIFSWHQWWYGGGFGSRPMIDTLPLLALPIAVLVEKALHKHILLGALLATVILAGVRLNLFQQKQYLSTIVHWDGMTKERYWEIWGKENWEGLKPFPHE